MSILARVSRTSYKFFCRKKVLRILLLLLLLRDDDDSFNFFFFVITLHSDGCICEVFKMHFFSPQNGGRRSKIEEKYNAREEKWCLLSFSRMRFVFNNTCCCYTKYRLLWLLDDDLSHHFLHQSDKIVSDIFQRDENLVASL